MGALKGRYGSVVALMCCLAAATIGVAQNTPGVFYAPVSADLGVALGTYSFFGTAQLLAIALVSLVVPRLLRTFGIKWIILFGMVCMTMSTVVLAFSSALPVIYLCGAVRGVGAAICANIPITMILNNWFWELASHHFVIDVYRKGIHLDKDRRAHVVGKKGCQM